MELGRNMEGSSIEEEKNKVTKEVSKKDEKRRSRENEECIREK